MMSGNEMPPYALKALQGSGQSTPGRYTPGSFGNIFAGLFGNAEAPYEDAMKQFKQYFGQATQAQNPFYGAGKNAIGGFTEWLDKMKDPQAFINKIMSGYQQSPWAKFLTDQSSRAGTNIASAEGTIGSTPFAQQMQQNAGNIASGDMNSWLQNVLGINNQYGAGQKSLMDSGQHSADILSQLFSGAGNTMSELGYGRESARQGQQGQLWGGIAGLFGL